MKRLVLADSFWPQIRAALGLDPVLDGIITSVTIRLDANEPVQIAMSFVVDAVAFTDVDWTQLIKRPECVADGARS